MKSFIYTRERGATLMILVILFTVISVTVTFGIVNPIIRQIQIARDFESSQKSYYAAEAASEDAFYRLKNNVAISFPLNTTFDGATINLTLAQISVSDKEITAQGVLDNNYRTLIKDITLANGFSFNFAIQSGLGGISMLNSSLINGNVYAAGAVTGNDNTIKGTVVSAGPTGLIDHIYATSSAYAHTIQNSTVDKDAYYQVKTSTTVGGNSFPGSADQPILTLPIPDSLVDTWKTEAATGGSVTCTAGSYTISASVTIGPKKIPCNLILSGSPTITLGGAIWVTGNITIQNSVIMKVIDSAGDKSIPVIADDPANQNGNGTITLKNNTQFLGATGQPDSYVFLVAMNRSAENGGVNLAIDVQNGAAGNVLLYAPHGELQIQNNVALREATAYKMTLRNNSIVSYSIGLAQSLFTSGPGGTWKIKNWREI